MSKTIGEKIRWMRVQRNKSQKEIAGLLNLSVAAYFKIEADKTDINISRLKQIAAIFDISPASLLLEEEPDSHGSKEIFALQNQLKTYRLQVLDLQTRLLTLYEKAI